MKHKRFNVEQIVAVLKQAEAGVPLTELTRRVGISEQTFYRWKKLYVALEVDQVRQLKQLQEENTRLKQLVADLTLDKAMLQDILSRKYQSPRGVGGSTTMSGDSDAATMAEDVHRLAAALKLERVYVVGHDIGAMVAYAFVRRYPLTTRGTMILDVPLPGIAGWDEIQGHPAMWHVRFMQVPGLAEKLVAGRQADYFSRFFQFGNFTPGDVAHFVKAYATLAQLHAVFEMYRAFPANAQFNAAQSGPNDVPLLLAAGDGSPFAQLVPKMAESLRANRCAHVETGLVRGAVHYIVEDQPEAVADLIER